jgi:hypothetical protein
MKSIIIGVGFLAIMGLASASYAFDRPCLASAAAPTWKEGESVPCSVDLTGLQRGTQGTTSAGEDVPNNVQKVEQRFSYLNIAILATTVIKNAPGFLHLISVNKTAALGTITCYDNTAGSGPVIATITQPASLLMSQINMLYDVVFAVGLTCVTATAAQDITVSYR